MQYGHFDDKNQEYVITTPKTPWPWINYLGSEDFFGLLSNTGGGYCFYKDARLRRLLRYRYNNIPMDQGGRYFYINDSGDVWSPSWQPVRADLDEYECRHGLGYSRIRGKKGGLEAELLFFVPRGASAEIHKVRITNTSAARRNISLFSYVEFCLWNAHDDQTNFQRNLNIAEMEVDGPAIYHKTEYRERRNHYSFYWVNTPVSGFDTDRDVFLGPYNGLEMPRAVSEARPQNSIADSWSPIASHCIQMDLAPGESRELVFVLGYVENSPDKKWESAGIINKEKSRALMARFATPEKVEKELAALTSYWHGLLDTYRVESGDGKLDRMVNTWNPYQCMITYHLSRSASYFESGIGRGLGFRDSSQDILGFVHMRPEAARARIMDLAATQLEDGGAYHQYQPLTKRGNHDIGGDFNDDPLWIILAASAYIKETGDMSLLEEKAPFNHAAASSATLFEHLRRSFMHVVNNRGPHGLPLIGRADWNDCLNLNCYSTNPDESFQTCTNSDGKTAESVLIAGMFVFIGREYVRMCRRIGGSEEAEAAEGHIAAMEKAIHDHGRDGNWFLRAYDAKGRPVGSSASSQGRIFIEPQGFCVMAGLKGGEAFSLKALDSVKTHLDTAHGITLVDPPYSDYHLELGEVSSYPPGYKENGGIFCHNNPWIIIAETLMGRGGQAFEYYRKISPAYREEIGDLHRMEPYVYSQMIAGKAARRHGEAKNSWLTGTAAWCYTAVSQYILGIRPDYDGLIIDPCIPEQWDGFKALRRFRGADYRISVRNPQHVSKGIAGIRVDGKDIEGTVLPVFADGRSHSVEAVMG